MKIKRFRLIGITGFIVSLCSCGGAAESSDTEESSDAFVTSSTEFSSSSQSSESQLSDYEKVIKYMRDNGKVSSDGSYIIGTDWDDESEAHYTYLFSYIPDSSTFLGGITAEWSTSYYYVTKGFFSVKPFSIAGGSYFGTTEIRLSSSSSTPLFRLEFSYEMDFGVYPNVEVASYLTIKDELKDSQLRKKFATFCGALLETSIKHTINIVRDKAGVKTSLW